MTADAIAENDAARAAPGAQAAGLKAPDWTPSFDCTKSLNGQERMVCASSQLSWLDVRLAAAYRKAAAAPGVDKKQLLAAQKAWRTNERDSCSDAACIETAYRNRLALLGD